MSNHIYKLPPKRKHLRALRFQRKSYLRSRPHFSFWLRLKDEKKKREKIAKRMFSVTLLKRRSWVLIWRRKLTRIRYKNFYKIRPKKFLKLFISGGFVKKNLVKKAEEVEERYFHFKNIYRFNLIDTRKLRVHYRFTSYFKAKKFIFNAHFMDWKYSKEHFILSLLERRLDVLLYRAGFAHLHGVHIIGHKNVYVNEACVKHCFHILKRKILFR